jgi:hypothetical protein
MRHRLAGQWDAVALTFPELVPRTFKRQIAYRPLGLA